MTGKHPNANPFCSRCTVLNKHKAIPQLHLNAKCVYNLNLLAVDLLVFRVTKSIVREMLEKEYYGNLPRSQLTNTPAGKPLTHVNAGLEGLALDKSAEEATGKSITSAVGVNDFLLLNGVNRESLDGGRGSSLGSSNDGRLRSLGNDDDTGAMGILLGKKSEVLRDLRNVGSVEVMGLLVSQRLALVTNDVVAVRKDGVHLVLEEGGQKWRRKVHGKDLNRLSVAGGFHRVHQISPC